jgi:hypothetical protein
MDLVTENDGALPTFAMNTRRFVMGALGERYKIRLTNVTASRVEAVVSVDGLDAIDGKAANVSKRGYLIDPFDSVTIEGWRTSLDAVAAFRFSSVPNSYAGRTDQDRNVGVIGVAVFRERPPPAPVVIAPRNWHSWEARRSAPTPKMSPPSSAAPSSASAMGEAAQDRAGLGTEFGEQHTSHVTQTTFQRESPAPSTIAELRYNDRDGLLAMGVPVPPVPNSREQRDVHFRQTAEAFPRTFATPPPQ